MEYNNSLLSWSIFSLLSWSIFHEKSGQMYVKTRIGVFACGQILCISPNGLQASHGMNVAKWFYVVKWFYVAKSV